MRGASLDRSEFTGRPNVLQAFQDQERRNHVSTLGPNASTAAFRPSYPSSGVFS